MAASVQFEPMPTAPSWRGPWAPIPRRGLPEVWKYALVLMAVWTFVAAGSLAWNRWRVRKSILALAEQEALAHFHKDVSYRHWSAGLGGVYAAVTPDTPPNPYLADVPERDIETPSGKKLTLINPAYMTRLVHELAEREWGARGHITSLNPLRAENSPDPWEADALQAIANGADQVATVETLDGEPHMRLIRPLRTKEACLKCHAAQGYQLGDIRGGISVSVPMAPFFAAEQSKTATDAISHGVIWLLGLAGIGWGAHRSRRNVEALEHANVALEQYIEKAEAATRAKSRFLANMSHEIRTPMTAILGFTDMLLDDEHVAEAREDWVESLRIIRRNGRHLLGLINDILDLSKIEAGKLETCGARCSPAEILAEMASLMRVRADAKNLSLAVEFASAVPETIFTDPLRLRQILINLVGNAVKFTETGGIRVVCAMVEPTGDRPRMRFDVIDSGIGMAEDQQSRLFVPFSQVDGSMTRRFGGTGLGLTISRQLAQMLGGDITVDSAPGRGSTFRLTIETGPLEHVPMVDHHAEALRGRKRPGARRRPAEPTPQLDGRILLAEDGPDNQRLFSFLLRKAGAEVTLAENGLVAYEKAMAAWRAGNPFDVILMDMQMPVVDGYTATARLRREGYEGPIVALTAHAMEGADAECRAAGCDGYAKKPIDRGELLNTVAQYLRANEAAGGKAATAEEE